MLGAAVVLTPSLMWRLLQRPAQEEGAGKGGAEQSVAADPSHSDSPNEQRSALTPRSLKPRSSRFERELSQEERALQEALQSGDQEAALRISLQETAADPWELVPDWLAKLRAENGWTNPPAVVEGTPLSPEESRKAIEALLPRGTNR